MIIQKLIIYGNIIKFNQIFLHTMYMKEKPKNLILTKLCVHAHVSMYMYM